MFGFKISDVIAINRNLSVQREKLKRDYKSWPSLSWGRDEVELMMSCGWLKSWADYFSVCSWFSCRGAEQLMGYLLDGWRRCFECLREVVHAVQRDYSHYLRACCAPQAWCRSIWDRTSSSWVKLWVEWCQVRHVGILLPSEQSIMLSWAEVCRVLTVKGTLSIITYRWFLFTVRSA